MKRIVFATGVLLSAGICNPSFPTAQGSPTPDTGASVLAFNSGDLYGSLPNDFSSSANDDINIADAAGALGQLTTTSGGYGFNVFASQYNSSQLAFIGGGGYIDIVLQTPVAGNGYLGIFTNAAFDLGNTGANGEPQTLAYSTGNTPSLSEYSALSQATISVGYIPNGSITAPTNLTSLAGGNVIALDVPSNYYTDTPLTVVNSAGDEYVSVGNGTTIASQAIPYYVAPDSADISNGEFDSLSPLGDQTSSAIESAFNNGAGGTWIPLGPNASDLVNFIQLSVPAGDALILDSVSAVPEPDNIFLLGIAALCLTVAVSRRGLLIRSRI